MSAPTFCSIIIHWRDGSRMPTVRPDIPEMDKADVNARGSERFRNVIAAMVAKLRTGRSILRDQFGPISAPTTANSSMGAAAE